MKKIVTSLFAVLILVGIGNAKPAETKYELALINAAKEGNAAQVRGLLEAGTDPNVTDKDGNTPLIYAAKENLAAVDMLLFAGADVNAKGEYGITPLINSFSIFGPEANAIRQRLLKAKADVNAIMYVRVGVEARDRAWGASTAGEYDFQYHRDADQRESDYPVYGSATALSFAAASNDVSAVEMLLKNGANVNIALMHPVLHTAIYSKRPNSTKIVELLLKAGADPWQGGAGADAYLTNRYKKEGLPSAKWAAFDALHACNDVGVTDADNKKALIEKAMATPTGKQQKLDKKLLAAARKGNAKQVKKLLEQGANPNSRGSYGETPLTENIDGNKVNVEVVQALLDAGANPNARYGIKYETPLMLAMCPKDMSAQKVEPILDKGMDVRTQVVKTLLSKGADVNARNRSYSTALYYCDESEGLEKTKLLIKAGADVNARNMYGRTPLFDANAEKIQLLVKAGADVNARDYEGFSALFAPSLFPKKYDDRIEALQTYGVKLTPYEKQQMPLQKQIFEKHLAMYEAIPTNEGSGLGQILLQGLLNAANDTANYAINNAGKF